MDVLNRREEDHVPEQHRVLLNLRGADLEGAGLRGTNLQAAILQDSYLRGAKVTDEQLADAWSVQGATMPNGQNSEEWLKDKEGSGKDVENQ